MDKQNKTLLLFTGEFPYGKKGEPYLEMEIPYLAKYFENIFVFPQKKPDGLRVLPANVNIVDVLIGEQKRIRNTNILSLFLAFIFICGEAFRTKKGYKYFLNLKQFVFIFINAKQSYIKLEKWIKRNNISQVLIYTYWSDNSLLACKFLKKKYPHFKIITRAHGFDLYNDRNESGLIPFQTTKYIAADKVYCISKHGQNYLKEQLARKYYFKLQLSYLSVKRPVFQNIISDSKIPIIMSCARMESFKRISMIPDVLKNIHTPIKWVHFGDGTEFEMVKEKIKSLPKHVEVELMGQQTNLEVHDFYQHHKIFAFLSLSTSEGLPVSMMEAISYGIPIIAVAVNGIPEIVNNNTGLLLHSNETDIEIAAKINEILYLNRFKEEVIKAFYEENFNSDINYDKFAKEISHLI